MGWFAVPLFGIVCDRSLCRGRVECARPSVVVSPENPYGGRPKFAFAHVVLLLERKRVRRLLSRATVQCFGHCPVFARDDTRAAGRPNFGRSAAEPLRDRGIVG